MSSSDESFPDDPVAGIDTSKPTTARVYNAFLGGKDNFDVDQQVVRSMKAANPSEYGSPHWARNWLLRVCRYLAEEAGIDQFLDCGCGLPAGENVHQAVQHLNPRVRVVYLDNDPVVAAYGRALLEDNEYTRFVVGDLRAPDAVLNHPVVTKHLDLSRPYALIQSATMCHVGDEDRPDEIMRSYIDALPSGSYLALSHFYDPNDGSELSAGAKLAEQLFRQHSLDAWFRTRERIESYFDGLEFIEPGLVELFSWWPDGPDLDEPAMGDRLILGGVAYKP